MEEGREERHISLLVKKNEPRPPVTTPCVHFCTFLTSVPDGGEWSACDVMTYALQQQ